MTQGTRVSRNLLYDNDLQDIWFEVNHGPYLMDNNICGSPLSLYDMSQGGAYVHNLFAGATLVRTAGRVTPYHFPHETDVAGFYSTVNGDCRFYNNLFLAAHFEEIRNYGLADYDKAQFPSFIDGNVYYKHALPSEKEKNLLAMPDFDPEFILEDKGSEVYIVFSLKNAGSVQTERVTTDRLGKAILPLQAYENPDGSQIVIDTDYFGNTRSNRPAPGPFKEIKDGKMRWKVW
jgi:hypothetical protein